MFVLEPLAPEADRAIVDARAAAARSRERAHVPELSTEAIDLLVRHADGDARRALNATEAVLGHLDAREAPRHDR